MKILIVRLGAIGDVIHALPALSAIRRTHPLAHISWVVERGPASSLLADNPYLDEVIELDSRAWRNDLLSSTTRHEVGGVFRRLRGASYDVSLDFQGLIKSAAIPLMAGIPRRLGFAFASLREPAAGLLLSERIEASEDEHVINKNLRLTEPLGCQPPLRYEFPISTSAADVEYVSDATENLGPHPVLLNPGGGWPTKLWPAGCFGEIADRLWERFGLPSVVTFGPGEESLAKAVTESARKAPIKAVRTSLKQFFVLAQRARLFLGGDTGPMHLAAAAGTPIVAVFGPTSSRRNGPFSIDDLVVERDDLECRVDCYRRKCEHTSCMDLPTELIWRAIAERLGKNSLDPTPEPERTERLKK